MTLRTFISLILQYRWWARGWEEPIGPEGPLVGAGLPAPWAFSPQPEPWQRAISQLIQSARIKEVAARVPEGELRNNLVKAAISASDDAIDQLCPPPINIPWPHPPRGFEVVSELARVASTLSDGVVREQLLDAAAQVAARSLSTIGANVTRR